MGRRERQADGSKRSGLGLAQDGVGMGGAEASWLGAEGAMIVDKSLPCLL